MQMVPLIIHNSSQQIALMQNEMRSDMHINRFLEETKMIQESLLHAVQIIQQTKFSNHDELMEFYLLTQKFELGKRMMVSNQRNDFNRFLYYMNIEFNYFKTCFGLLDKCAKAAYNMSKNIQNYLDYILKETKAKGNNTAVLVSNINFMNVLTKIMMGEPGLQSILSEIRDLNHDIVFGKARLVGLIRQMRSQQQQSYFDFYLNS